MSLGALALALLAGLLSVLSPCVLPLLPLVLGAAASQPRFGPVLLALGVALSFVAIFELPGENGELLFARMRYRGCNFTINQVGWDSDARPPADSSQTSPFLFYLYVDDVVETTANMKACGGVEVFPPREEIWGDLRSRLRDPFGYVWDLAQSPR